MLCSRGAREHETDRGTAAMDIDRTKSVARKDKRRVSKRKSSKSSIVFPMRYAKRNKK